MRENLLSQHPFEFNEIIERTFVGEVHFRDQMTSTSDVAAELVRSRTVDCPLLVLTANQTAGRGRHSRSWYSNEGSLTFTLVLPEERLSAGVERILSLATGVGCATALNRLVGEEAGGIGLKWPNDLFASFDGVPRKLAGILAERVVGQGATCFVIGIGVNVANSGSGVPDDVATSAVSLDMVTAKVANGPGATLQGVLLALLTGLESVFSCDASDVVRQINELSILNDKSVQLRLPDGSMVGGICRGIEADGGLKLELASASRTQIFRSATVESWTEMSTGSDG